MKNILFPLLAFALLLPSTMMGQGIREANFHFKQENYPVALKNFLNVYKKDTSNVDVCYGIGICKVRTNSMPADALKYLLKAEVKYGQEEDFLLALTRAYLYNHDFENARATLSKARTKSKNVIELDAVGAYIDNAERLVKSPLNVTFVNLGKNINSDMDDITPMLSADNSILVYSTNRKFDTEISEYSWDVLSVNSESGDFKKNKAVTAVNSIENEMVAGWSNSGDELFFMFDGYGAEHDLMSTSFEKGAFKGKNMLSQTVNTKLFEQGAYATQNGDTLFFSSEGLEGFGGLDLYYSVKLPNGDWSTPENLGDSINTLYDETYPMLSADGRKLYFCSNGLNSMGGYDIFVCDIDTDGLKLGKPQNIGYPLNDCYDNLTISYTVDENYAYVSAIKPDSYGYSDIYRVVFNDKDPMVRMYLVKLVTQQGEQTADFGETEKNLKVTVFTKNKTVYGTYNYNPTSSQVPVALLPGTYTLEIEGETIEPFSMKINVPNAPGKPIENVKAVLKVKK